MKMKTNKSMIELDIDKVPTRFYFDYIICRNPDCHCNGVIMQLSNKERVLDFFFDFSTESYKPSEFTKEETMILNTFIDFMKSDKQNSLTVDYFKKQYDLVKKNEQNRKEVLEEFPLGGFLPYNEILWEDDYLTINWNDRNYLLYDAYCVTPDCPCTTAALHLFENIHKTGMRQPEFSFIYDYKTQNIDEPMGIKPKNAKQFTDTFPLSLQKKLKQRHRRLKEEVKQEITKKIEQEKYSSVQREKRKIGRNDPCPCGSGKKYKKCCGSITKK
jgi:hypothetical protein